MAEHERLAALRRCRDEYRNTLEKVNDQLPSASQPDQAALLDQERKLTKKIEQAEIEIRFIEDINGLIADYTSQQAAAYANAEATNDPPRKKAFEQRAHLCEVVINEALEKKQTVKPIPQETLNEIFVDLKRAAQEAKDTVDSANRAIRFANQALDALIMLMKVASKFAI